MTNNPKNVTFEDGLAELQVVQDTLQRYRELFKENHTYAALFFKYRSLRKNARNSREWKIYHALRECMSDFVYTGNQSLRSIKDKLWGDSLTEALEFEKQTDPDGLVGEVGFCKMSDSLENIF